MRVVVGVTVRMLAGLIDGLWRYAGTATVFQIARGVTLSALVFGAAVAFAGAGALPLTLIVLVWVGELLLLLSARLAWRLWRERQLGGSGAREVRTLVIERISPLRPDDEAYFVEAIFRGTWGERLRRYMSKDDYAELDRLCDPSKPEFAPRRADFHFLQTFTLAVGRA